MCSVLALVSLGACGDGSEAGSADGTGDTTEGDSNRDPATEPADSESEVGEALPAECALAPFAATVQREGSDPAGSDDFEVVDAVTLPIPIVPDPSSTIDAAATRELAATTDLLGYSMIFGDEQIQDATAEFGGYEPVEDGKLRAMVSVFPASLAPLVAGDVVTDGRIEGLSAPLPTIGMDLKTSEDETNVYLNSVVGQVEVLAVNGGAICLDIDLSWTLSQPEDNTLTIEGVFAGRLLDRATSLTLS
jgi:hypothetical protein